MGNRRGKEGAKERQESSEGVKSAPELLKGPASGGWKDSWTTKVVLGLGAFGLVAMIANCAGKSKSVSNYDEAGYPKAAIEPATDQNKEDGKKAKPSITAYTNAGCVKEELRTMGTGWLGDGVARGIELLITNKSRRVAFLEIKSLGTLERETTAVVMPGDQIKFPLVSRGFEGSIAVGGQWCNRDIGWLDSAVTKISPAAIASSDAKQLQLFIGDAGNNKVGYTWKSVR